MGDFCVVLMSSVFLHQYYIVAGRPIYSQFVITDLASAFLLAYDISPSVNENRNNICKNVLNDQTSCVSGVMHHRAIRDTRHEEEFLNSCVNPHNETL